MEPTQLLTSHDGAEGKNNREAGDLPAESSGLWAAVATTDTAGHHRNCVSHERRPGRQVAGDGVKTLQLPGPSHPHGTIVTLACRLPP